MSYEIMYDKAFIKAGNNYIPVIQYGSNNCFEIIYRNGRSIEVPEKNWTVWRYSPNTNYHNHVLFTADEIIKLAGHISEPNTYGEILHKSRHSRFEQEELRRWFCAGMKSALSVEDYVGRGDGIIFTVKVIADKVTEQVREYVVTTQQLLELIGKYEDIEDSNTYVSVGFIGRSLNKPKRERKPRQQQQVVDPYVIDINGGYFIKKTRYGYRYSFHRSSARKFRTEAEAVKYAAKSLPYYTVTIYKIEGTYWK